MQKEMLENRAFMYKMLSQIYKKEISKEFYARLSELKFPPQDEDDELAQGYREFEAFFTKKHLDPITDLAVDYARVFLGAGVLDGVCAFPYESVYTSESKLVMQEARDEVVAIYADFGLGKDDGLDVPEDHVGLELEFMAFLCERAIEALNSDDTKRAKELLNAQADFLQNHLLNWAPKFTDDIRKCAQSPLYIAVSKITDGFLMLDKDMIRHLLEAV